jgi:hypothetical protein
MSLGIIYRLISIQRLEGKRFTNKRNSKDHLIRRTGPSQTLPDGKGFELNHEQKNLSGGFL